MRRLLDPLSSRRSDQLQAIAVTSRTLSVTRGRSEELREEESARPHTGARAKGKLWWSAVGRATATFEDGSASANPRAEACGRAKVKQKLSLVGEALHASGQTAEPPAPHPSSRGRGNRLMMAALA